MYSVEHATLIENSVAKISLELDRIFLFAIDAGASAVLHHFLDFR